MTESFLALDNDVLLKLACYDLTGRITEATKVPYSQMHILGAARYVLASVIAKDRRIMDKVRATGNLTQFISSATELEPSDAEVDLATQIEEVALIRGVDLDTGESQLCAVVVTRALGLLVTGDKRAIIGIEQLLDQLPWLAGIEGHVASLEQLLARYLDVLGGAALRQSVCAERGVDKAVSICFSCGSPGDAATPAEGLLSYISDLRMQAPRVLAPSYERA